MMDGNDEMEGKIFMPQACSVCGSKHDVDTEPHFFLYLEDDHYEELRDPISLEPFWEPVTLNSSCKHVFSKDSVVAAINAQGCCPIDKSPQALSDIETAPLVIHNLLEKLKVFCPNHCCTLPMERGQLSAHLKMCPQANVICQRCDATVHQVDTLVHDDECPRRRIQCDKGCNCHILLTDLDTHNCTTMLLNQITELQDDSYTLKRLKSLNSQLYIAKWEHSSETQYGIAVSTSYLFLINRNGTRILTLDFNGVFKRSWDVVGTQTSIAALDDDVYVTGLPDSSGKRQVQVYSSEGVLIRSWTRKGRRNRGYSQSPSRLAISNKGEVYVADSWGRNVQVFDRNGSFVRKWNHRGEDQPSEVESIAISESNDGEDEVYLAHDDRIEIFSGCGIYQRTLQVEKWNDDDEEEEFTTTTSAMAISKCDNKVYVSGTFSKTVQIVDNNDGHYIGKFDTVGGCCGIAIVDNTGDAYVLDNTGIQVFTSDKRDII